MLITVGLLAAIGGGLMLYFIAKQPDSFVTQKIIRPIVGFVSGFKKFEDVDHAKPAHILTATEIHAAFEGDEAKAKTEFEGKVVQVNGIISSIASPNDANRVILLEVDGNSNVSCQMDPQFIDRLIDIAVGDDVAIKGICSGSKKDDLLGSLDVLLNRSVLVK
jgi:hypothetical protein